METAKKKPRPSAAKIAAEVIKEFEGYSSKPYLCPSGIATIGYGNTRYLNGERVSMDDPEIDKKEAEKMLLDTVKFVEKDVKNVLEHKLKAHKMAALISFTYNVGIGALSNSTLLAWVNSNPDYSEIPSQFRRWNRGGGKVLKGLIRRREAEIELWEGTSQYI
jgi:lysozyme